MDAANKETMKDQEDQKEAFAAEIAEGWTFPSHKATWQGRALEWVWGGEGGGGAGGGGRG